MDVKTPDKVLAASCLTVALTTAIFPYITGWGTVLFQLVTLRAWGIVAHFSSGEFADLHHSVVWLVALLLNMVAFCIVAIPIWVICRGRAPKVASVATICWLSLYVAMLFFLFRATDGP